MCPGPDPSIPDDEKAGEQFLFFKLITQPKAWNIWIILWTFANTCKKVIQITYDLDALSSEKSKKMC